ncbi:hypothetical protein P3T76_004170 [Phytophthora citrophthora]|uniref:Uncharacterized protein n=1 Tax=Phytophthora citrophthora TaxID=4793 RepID=A0AAD9LNU4_9STRA|nr:hypothetical protein P3T76_004170 [Phytophthora citrophthora]
MGQHTNGEDIIVVGWSYGTMLGERLMHLDPPEVVGYVLDGIAASMGAWSTEFPYYSNWDSDCGEVADRFLSMCQEDEETAARFEEKGLRGRLST